MSQFDFRYRGRPAPRQRWEPNARAISSCQYVHYDAGQTRTCGEPTAGKAYCPECARKTLAISRPLPSLMKPAR